MNLSKIITLLSLTLLLSACGSAEPTTQAAAPTETPIVALPPFEWTESEPEAQGMDGAMLDEIPAYIETSLSNLTSVLVVRNGELVYEHYVGSRNVDSGDLVWSVTKSFTSALIGMAIDEGFIDSVEQPLSDFYSAEQLASADSRLADVSLHDLLTMTSGTWCQGDACFANSLDDVLAREMKDEPGSDFVYDTSASHLLSGVLLSATGMSAEAYAEENIFDPLAFDEELAWQSDAQGNNFGGHGMRLNSRDMAKFGQLYLDEGMWRGEQLISAEFVAETTQNQVASKSAEDGYGYLFWIGETDGHPSYAAVGYGGQYIHVVPALELVTVITSNYNRPWPDNATIIEKFVVPAITP